MSLDNDCPTYRLIITVQGKCKQYVIPNIFITLIKGGIQGRRKLIRTVHFAKNEFNIDSTGLVYKFIDIY